MSLITPTQPIEPPNLSEWIPAPLFRISLEKYEEMVDSGVLSPAGHHVPVVLNGVETGSVAVDDILP
jgi:hypothetical protein